MSEVAHKRKATGPVADPTFGQPRFMLGRARRLARATRRLSLDIDKIRNDFPILGRLIRGKCLVYLDNAATTQKPRVMIDTVRRFYEAEYANIHRGIYYLSEQATEAYEAARVRVQKFLNAAKPEEIVFTRGATESINLVAQSFGRKRFLAGDEILITEMEHHSNIVPWQLLRDQLGVVLKVIPFNERGEILLHDVERLITKKTRLLSIVHVSNVLGTINPVKEIIRLAHARGIPVLIDGAQAAPHMTVDVQDLGCDFYVFSGHKVYGPTGIGVLYGQEELLQEMPPYQGGGDMIQSVTFEKTLYKEPPHKFEAGTPNIVGAIGLTSSLDYVAKIGLDKIAAYEQDLLEQATAELTAVPGVRVIGTAEHKTSLISFVVQGIHPHDLGTVLDQEGIAIRAGHHCAQPVMEHFKIPATVRASFSFYNTPRDVDIFVAGLKRAQEIFK